MLDGMQSIVHEIRGVPEPTNPFLTILLGRDFPYILGVGDIFRMNREGGREVHEVVIRHQCS